MVNFVRSYHLNLRSYRRKQTAIILLICALIIMISGGVACSAIPGLVILPPQNKTGNPELNWLAAGLQDAMTVIMWGVHAVKTVPITEYGQHTGYDPIRVSQIEIKQAAQLARKVKADLLWVGEYSMSGKEAVTLSYSVYGTESGELLGTREIKTTLHNIQTIPTRITPSLISASRITASTLELQRIEKPPTESTGAFEQNARGFSGQLQKIQKTIGMAKEWNSSAQFYSKAVEIDPGYAEAFVNLGWALYHDRSKDAALKSFTRAVTLKPYLLDGWMGLGYIHRDSGNSGMALEAFQKAVDLNGSLEWPRQELNTVVIPPVTRQPGTSTSRQIAAEIKYKDFEVSLSVDDRKSLQLTEHEKLDIRLGAIKNLVRSKRELAFPFLKQMINRQDQAFEVLKLMVDISITQSTPYLVEALEKHCAPDGSRLASLSDENIRGVLQLIGRRKIEQAKTTIIPLLQDKNPDIRESASLTLGTLGARDTVAELLKQAATEKNRRVFFIMLVSLTQLGDVKSKTELGEIFREGKEMSLINYATKIMKQRNISLK